MVIFPYNILREFCSYKLGNPSLQLEKETLCVNNLSKILEKVKGSIIIVIKCSSCSSR